MTTMNVNIINTAPVGVLLAPVGLAGDIAAVATICEIHDDDAAGLAAYGPVRTATGVDR